MTAVDFRFNEYIQKINAEKEAEKRKKIEKIENMKRSLRAFSAIKICGAEKKVRIGAFLAIVLESAALMWMSWFAIRQSIILYGTPDLGLGFAVICQLMVFFNIFILAAATAVFWYHKKSIEKKEEKLKEEIKKEEEK